MKFVVAADLVNHLVTAQAKNSLARALNAWAAYDLLYKFFSRRYQLDSTIVTTNLAFKEWGKLFNNTAAGCAIADRLVHKGLLIRIAGRSRRSDQETET